ncbi:hypothetical protein [uncultured Fluviicola sp.]|uniref:hypothetical protein n=1 Tax=uncultured Fluviicola sp. TaxID=463303 RepID=UPI0025D1A0AB|nr:hypothetical protein [uncultured Fluviicola sp.]
MKLYIIFPKDSTTDFLEEIVNYLEDNLITSSIKVFRLKSEADHRLILDNGQALFSEDSTVLFMGHGMSSAISGALTIDYNHGVLIQETELSLFQKRRLILLSCRSNEFILKYSWGAKLKGSIGFPNLVTDDYDRYGTEDRWINEVTERDIENYRNDIVDVLKYSLEDYLEQKLSFFQLYKRIKLRAQRKLISYCKTLPNSNRTAYWHMLNDLSHGVVITGN